MKKKNTEKGKKEIINTVWGEHEERDPTAGDGVGKARDVFEQEVTCRMIDMTWREGRRKG